MIGFLCSLAFLHTAQRGTPAASMIRFTGRDGGFLSESDIRLGLREIPYDPPNPQIFGYHSVAFTEAKHFSVFDRSYRPLRAMFAKIDLVNLIIENGPNTVYTITQLPYSLYDELIELMDYALNKYEARVTTVMTVTLNLKTKLQLPRTYLESVETPAGADDVIAKAKLLALDRNPMQRSDAHAEMVKARELKYQYLPVVKIYGDHDSKYQDFSANEKRANTLFDDWLQKENFNTDKRLFDYLERMNVWTDKAAIFRCKVFNDLATQAPAAYQSMMASLTKSFSDNGYVNEDAFRRDLSNATTQSTMTFNIQVGLGDGKTAIVSFP